MDSFTSKAPLTVGGATYEINRLDAVAGLEKLPYALKVLAELIKDGDLTVEDVKSEATRQDRTYINKAKQMRECLGIPVTEI